MAARRRQARVRYLPRAKRDVFECALYLADTAGVPTAERFMDAIEKTQARIADNPAVGSPRAFPDPRLRGLRQWPVRGFRNYLVYYVLSSDDVRIVRVLHAARDRSTLRCGLP